MTRKIKLTYFENQRTLRAAYSIRTNAFKITKFWNEYGEYTSFLYTPRINTLNSLPRREIYCVRDEIYPLAAFISLSVKVKTCSGYR